MQPVSGGLRLQSASVPERRKAPFHHWEPNHEGQRAEREKSETPGRGAPGRCHDTSTNVLRTSFATCESAPNRSSTCLLTSVVALRLAAFTSILTIAYERRCCSDESQASVKRRAAAEGVMISPLWIMTRTSNGPTRTERHTCVWDFLRIAAGRSDVPSSSTLPSAVCGGLNLLARRGGLLSAGTTGARLFDAGGFCLRLQLLHLHSPRVITV